MTSVQGHVYISAASRGIGFTIAERFAQDGYSVAISSRNLSQLEKAKTSLEAKIRGATVRLYQGDLSEQEGQQNILDRMRKEGFWPDIFICNGGQPPDTRLETLGRNEWQKDSEMILGQAIFSAQQFLPVMANKGYGRLIFVSSIYAKAPENRFLAGTIARAGLFALSKAISEGYARRGVASFTIGLGYVDTPLLRNMAQGFNWETPRPLDEPAQGPWQPKYREWEKTIPAGRIGSAEELANIVRFLAMPEAAYLNGAVLSFSGGLDKFLI